MRTIPAAALLMLAACVAWASDPPGTTHAEPAPAASSDSSAPTYTPPKAPKIRAKGKTEDNNQASSSDNQVSLLAPDVDVIDAPTTAVLDYGGYSSQSRMYRAGGLLEWVSFGVYNGINIGAAAAVDGLIGDSKDVHVRAPTAQVKWRFYDGDRWIPSLAAGYDGQGYDWNSLDDRYNQKQRGGYLVASQELGVPGLMLHPSVNISDFNHNGVFGALPLSYNIKDKVSLLAEWDNINNYVDSRVNVGARFYVTPHFDVDFAVRAIGQGGHFNNGDSRGPERVIQLRYVGNF